MNNRVLNLSTEESLLDALKKASERKPTAEELMSQRVSFIFGSVGNTSGITRSQIKDVLMMQTGSKEGKG